MKINVLAQDPSMNNWGLVQAIYDTTTKSVEIVNMAVLVNKKDTDKKKTVRVSSIDLDRARELTKGIGQAIATHEARFTFVEVPHGSQSASAMKGYGMCVGVLASIGIPMVQLSEADCKKATLGKTKATKAESIDWAMQKHPEAPWRMQTVKGVTKSVDGYNEHVADAIAALYAGIDSMEFKSALQFIQ